MNERDAVRERLSQLGAQFIQRTAGEMGSLHTLVGRVSGGDASAAEELRHLAHRMHGTGATLGFTKISELAGQIEHLCEAGQGSEGLADLAAKLQSEVDAQLPAQN